jgi:hypothetical protein
MKKGDIPAKRPYTSRKPRPDNPIFGFALNFMGQTGVKLITDLKQLIYISQPFGFDGPTLGTILLDARMCNERDGITGALVCRHDVYLQLLEGPADKIDATYARILRDDRHANVNELVNRTVSERIFADWAMLHDPEKSWVWSRSELADGVLKRATQAEIVEVFETLSEKAKADSSP